MDHSVSLLSFIQRKMVSKRYRKVLHFYRVQIGTTSVSREKLVLDTNLYSNIYLQQGELIAHTKHLQFF